MTDDPRFEPALFETRAECVAAAEDFVERGFVGPTPEPAVSRR